MTLRSFSPSDPSDLVLEFEATEPDAVAASFELAAAAGRDWWRAGAAARSAALNAAAALLEQRSDEFVELVIREVGKPRSEAVGEVARGVAILRYYSQMSFAPRGEFYPPSLPGLLWSERRPLGVAGLITPWNFPIAIPLWKAAPALCAGNAVVLKPSTEAMACARALESLLAEALPAHLFTVTTSREVTAHADVISFTGSNEVGQLVAMAAASRGVPVQAELGGQNAAIVMPDAEPRRAAAHIVSGAMWFAGQKCTATRRVIIVGANPEFEAELISAVRSLQVGDPREASNLVGPLINEAAVATFTQAVEQARAIGAEVVTGGERLPRPGYFVNPTVLRGVPADHPLSCQEVFGPLVTLHYATDLEHAIALSNSVEYGLVSAIHSNDQAAIGKFIAETDTGMIKVNAPTAGVDFYAPFGGEKESSIGGREQGLAALDFYSTTRTITYSS